VDDWKALIDELNRIRLEEDRSYAYLADEIGIDPGAFHKILNGGTPNPRDRTLYKIRRYLDQRKPASRRKAATA
jgi:transcriptional regulator with XRE-family HTH domain